MKGLLLVSLIGFATGSVVTVRRAQKIHHAMYGHFIPYGWHVDVGTVVVDPLAAIPHPDSKGGIVVPAEGQWTRVVNFTLLPGVVEACMSGNTPVFHLKTEQLDRGTGKWTLWPPSEKRMCTFPIKSKVIWPLQFFDTYPTPVAKIVWFERGDWIRIVGLAKWSLAEVGREFVSPPFQIPDAK